MHLFSLATSLLAYSTFATAATKHAHALRKDTTQLQATFSGAGGVTGSIIASQSTKSSNVVYAFQLQLPSIGAPFAYHVHVNPVNSDGSCASTGPHLDPANVTETPPCNAAAPQTCQAGDLSGKYGKINGTSATFTITDPYTSLAPSVPDSILGRSIVVHSANGTRISCANLTVLDSGSGSTPCAYGNISNSSAPTGWISWSPSATTSPYIGCAAGMSPASIMGTFILVAGIVMGGWML